MQGRANESKVFGLGERVLQTVAMPGNPLFLTRNEQVSGSSPLVGSPSSADLQEK